MSTSYDDAEGMLQDQGLEVVVIPYRPSPPPRPPRPPKLRGNASPTDKNAATNLNLASPASDESKISDDDDDGDSVVSSPPPPSKQLFTPRSQAAMAEAIGQKIEVSPPPPPPPKLPKQPLKKASTTQPPAPRLADKQGNTKKTNPGRSHSVGPGRSHSAGDAAVQSSSSSSKVNNNNGSNNNNNNNKPKNKKSPPRIRSKSTPSKSSSKQKPNSKKNGNNHHEKPSFIQMAKLGYQELCNAIIRPPRSNYPLEALGPEKFVFCGEQFVRKDFGVVNERGLLLECSMWKRAYEEEEEEEEEVIGTVGDIDYEEERQTNDDNDNDGNENENSQQITLNVDDWDENKERGAMYLHVPESFEEESISSSGLNDDYCDEGLDCFRELEKDDGCSNNDDYQQNNDSSGGMNNNSMRQEHSEPTAQHTYYQGSIKTRKRHRDPVVIYLHGNSSARTEVIPQLGHLLSLGVSVVSFDFAGSGKSEGEFVSLGYYEREDLQTVIHHLRVSGDVSTIALWGRSMGAATAIMYGSRDPTISCMILDSSFTELTRLAEEMVEKGKEQGVNVPNFVVSVALRMIKSSVKSQAGFSIRHISPISHVNRCFIPAMFVAGEHDDFINKRHSELLHTKYAGDKNIVVVDGDHNSPRPRFLLQSACLFLQSCMQLPPSLELVVPLGTNLLAPPWICPGGLNRLGLGQAIEQARAEASKNSDDRCWLPIDDNNMAQQQQQQIQKQAPKKKVSLDDTALNSPGLPFEQGGPRSRSCTDVHLRSPRGGRPDSPTAEDILEASAPPDMSERQKEIQSSLFKMLGQHE
ncbi:hypothetical protein ACHAXR_012012 [Thalassiosira sp. AJA248-18]